MLQEVSNYPSILIQVDIIQLQKFFFPKIASWICRWEKRIKSQNPAMYKIRITFCKHFPIANVLDFKGGGGASWVANAIKTVLPSLSSFSKSFLLGWPKLFGERWKKPFKRMLKTTSKKNIAIIHYRCTKGLLKKLKII